MHLSLLLIFTLGIYIYRDLYPLVTFTLMPKDGAEGTLLWTKIFVLVVTGIFVPVAMPRQYVPFDPKVGQFAFWSAAVIDIRLRNL